ncbi:hypothetical protein SMICM304S_07993 [Streptomyces microflavus]
MRCTGRPPPSRPPAVSCPFRPGPSPGPPPPTPGPGARTAVAPGPRGPDACPPPRPRRRAGTHRAPPSTACVRAAPGDIGGGTGRPAPSVQIRTGEPGSPAPGAVVTSPVRGVPSGADQVATTGTRSAPASGSPENRRVPGTRSTTTATVARRSSCWARDPTAGAGPRRARRPPTRPPVPPPPGAAARRASPTRLAAVGGAPQRDSDSHVIPRFPPDSPRSCVFPAVFPASSCSQSRIVTGSPARITPVPSGIRFWPKSS